MEVEDVIELGSSDDEAEPPAPKKIKPQPNAMVHIPNKIRDVTINPVTCNKNKLSRKLVSRVSDNIVTNVRGNAQQSKINGRHLQKLTPQLHCRNLKTDKPLQLQNKLNNYPLQVLPRKPLRIGKLNSGVQGSRIQGSSPMLINSLPSSITVTKTSGGRSVPHTGVFRSKIRVNKEVTNKTVGHSNKKIYPAGCIGEILTVELDDDETSQSTVTSSSPQWYLRPEEQLIKNNLEDLNNSEPQAKEMIEITIEDSPVKPCLLGGTKNVSDSFSITIEDSPVKVLNKPINEAELGSDIEQDIPKSPQSKKKLDYPETEKCINNEVLMEIETGDVIENKFKKSKDGEENPSASPNDEEKRDTNINRPVTPIVNLEQENNFSLKQDIAINDNLVDNGDKVDEKESTGIDIEVSNGEFHSTFQRFMDLCLEKDNSEDMKTIVEKRIKTYSRQVPKEFVESEQFLDMVSTKITLIKSEPSKIYLHIKDVVDELKLHRKRKKAIPLVTENDPVEDMEDDNNKYDRKRRRQIRKLEKTLKKLERAINKLDEQEVDFDDEEDSVYLLNDRYKERFVRTYEKLCQLTDTKMLSEPRIVIESRPGQPPGPAKKIEKWINKKVPIGTPLPFPDFHDVVKCVREANAEDRLGWNEADIMDEARDLFTRCGKKLQRRRQENEWRLACSRITQDVDPAQNDETLRKKLDENKAKACKKEAELFNKYTQKQNQLKLEAIEIDDKEADRSPVESDDEIDDESNSLEDSQKRKDRLQRLLDEKESRKKSVNNTEQQTDLENKKESESVTSSIENKEDDIESVNDQDITDVEKSNKLSEKTETETNIDRQNLVEKINISNNDKCTSDIVNKDMCVEIIDDFNKERILSENVEEIGSDESVKEIFSHETTNINLEPNHNDDKHIHLICDDFYGDELNLLEKLNSGNETSSSDSSDIDDSPIAVSDSLDSNSEPEHYETYDVISIENSSCSETETSTSVNNIERQCTLMSNNVCDLIDEVPNSHNIDASKAGTIAVNDITASDEDTENIVLAYSDDEDCTDKDTDYVKPDNDYFNLQDDSITIGETFVGIVDDTERLREDVPLNKCEKSKHGVILIDKIEKQARVEDEIPIKSANDDIKRGGHVISKDENVNDRAMSISEKIINLVEMQSSVNKVDLKKSDKAYIKHKDDNKSVNKIPMIEIRNIDNAKLDADINTSVNYDEAMSISEEESILEEKDFCSRGPKDVKHKVGETLTGDTYEDNTRKKYTMSGNLNRCDQKCAKNDDNALSINEKLQDESINSDGNNEETKCDNKCVKPDDHDRTINEKIKDVITNKGHIQKNDFIVKSSNNDVKIQTNELPSRKTFVNIVVSEKSTDGDIEFNKCNRDFVQRSNDSQLVTKIGTNRSEDWNPSKYDSENIQVVAIQASDCKSDVPITLDASRESFILEASREPKSQEESGEPKILEDSKKPVTVATQGESIALEAQWKPRTLETSGEPETVEASVAPKTLKTNGESKIVEASEALKTLEVSRKSKTTEVSGEPMILEPSQESNTNEMSGELIRLEAKRAPKTTESSGEAITLNAQEEPTTLETSGVNNENVSNTNESVSTTVENSMTLEDTFNMVEMMLDKLFNSPT